MIYSHSKFMMGNQNAKNRNRKRGSNHTQQRANQNRLEAIVDGSATFIGEKCRHCFGMVRWVKKRHCFSCYNERGQFKEITKRRQQLLSRVLSQGRLKGLECGVTANDIKWNETCPVLGIHLDYYSIDKSDNIVSFDRKNPKKGYVKGNVFVVSFKANTLKDDMDTNELERLLEYVKS